MREPGVIEHILVMLGNIFNRPLYILDWLQSRDLNAIVLLSISCIKRKEWWLPGGALEVPYLKSQIACQMGLIIVGNEKQI